LSNNRLLEISLGYFGSPLVHVLLARIVLGEKLRRAQIVAIALAVGGVVVLLAKGAGIPWLAFLLAATFPSYALLRKISGAKSLSGLAGETVLASVPSIIYLVWLERTTGGAFIHAGVWTTALLAGGGVATALPLLLFGYAARRISLTTLGFTQYLCPSIMFVLSITLYGKSVDDRLPTFVLIWIGLVIFTWDGIVARRRGRGELAEADRPELPVRATSK
jgi:chloramphenicol-sensitive protein RarD